MKIIKWFIDGFKMSWDDFRYNTPWKFVIATWFILGIISLITGIEYNKLFMWFMMMMMALIVVGIGWTLVGYWISKNKYNKS